MQEKSTHDLDSNISWETPHSGMKRRYENIKLNLRELVYMDMNWIQNNSQENLNDIFLW